MNALPIWQDACILWIYVYGPILRHLRESKGRLQAEVARSVGISPAHLARLESNQRGLYVEDFVRIAEALGEKPGNLLSNDVGDIGHLKPLIDRLAVVPPEWLPRVTAIIEALVLLTEDRTAAAVRPERKQRHKPPRKSTTASRRKTRR
jgi:transcriptional regulator with XRE-family HTH domain